MEDYKKLYEEALERAKHVALTNEHKSAAEYIFPEIVESDDERIRKDLMAFLINMKNGDFGCFPSQSLYQQWIAWLEKQKEQKPVDEEELSKFCEANFNAGKRVVLNNPEEYGLQKPLEWSDEDEANIDYLIDYFNSFENGGKPELPLSAARNFCNWLYTLKDKIKMSDERLKSLQPQLKVELNEDGKKVLSELINYHEDLGEVSSKHNKWLKFLKSICPQPKQEWSEEDDRIMNDIKCFIQFSLHADSAVCPGGRTTKKEAITWLKSLCPPKNWKKWWCEDCKVRYNHWKPSNEQMEFLGKAILILGEEGDCKTSAVLNELRIDLKKL